MASVPGRPFILIVNNMEHSSNCLGLFEVEKGSHGCGDCNGSGEGKKANRSEEYGPECSDVEDEETGGSSDEETVSLDSCVILLFPFAK